MNFRVHPAKTLSSALLALVFAFALSAAAMDVTFDVQPRLLNLGETAQATLVFHGVNSAPGIEFPPIPGLQITGTGQVIQNINGASSVRLTYNLFPQKPGPHVIGPYTLDFNGEQIQIPEVKLEVRARDGAAGASTNEMIFARITLPDQPPYIHQVFDITLGLYSLPGVNLTRDVNLLGGFPESGFVIGNFEELQMVREEVDGQFYNLRRFRAKARALTAGTFPLRPALRVGVVDPNQRRQQDPFFDNPFFGGPAATPVNVSMPPADLTIRPIPGEDRPENFSGAVGHFEFAMDVRPRELKVGEPVTVSLRLQGSGNIAAAMPPAYRDADSFKAYEARQVGDIPDHAAERGAKTFEQVVIPRTEELKELPALQFSFFDPAASLYRTISAGPFPLTVHPSENGADSLMLQIPGAAAAGGRSLILGSDIVYLKSAPARWRNGGGLAGSQPLLVGLHAVAPLALAGMFFATRRRNRLAADIALARRQKAPRSARAALRKAEAAFRDKATPAAVFEPLADATFDYFANRLNLPPGAVDASRILDILGSVKIAPEDLAQWKKFFALSDLILYAHPPPFSKEELSAWIPTVASLLRKAERIRL